MNTKAADIMAARDKIVQKLLKPKPVRRRRARKPKPQPE